MCKSQVEPFNLKTVLSEKKIKLDFWKNPNFESISLTILARKNKCYCVWKFINNKFGSPWKICTQFNWSRSLYFILNKENQNFQLQLIINVGLENVGLLFLYLLKSQQDFLKAFPKLYKDLSNWIKLLKDYVLHYPHINVLKPTSELMCNYYVISNHKNSWSVFKCMHISISFH